MGFGSVPTLRLWSSLRTARFSLDAVTMTIIVKFGPVTLLTWHLQPSCAGLLLVVSRRPGANRSKNLGSIQAAGPAFSSGVISCQLLQIRGI